MSGLFSHCDSLETVNLRGLETRKGYYSPALWFDGCDSLKQVTIGSEFASSLSLPKQSGSSGRWVSSVDGVAYKSDELPSGMEVTYTVQLVDDYGKTWMQAGTCAWRVEDETLHIAPLPGCDNGTLRYGDLRLGNDWDSFSQSIKHVIFASGVSAYTCEGMFKDFRNLQDVDFSGLDASTTTSMSYMFSGCEGARGRGPELPRPLLRPRPQPPVLGLLVASERHPGRQRLCRDRHVIHVLWLRDA